MRLVQVTPHPSVEIIFHIILLPVNPPSYHLGEKSARPFFPCFPWYRFLYSSPVVKIKSYLMTVIELRE
jgi:hypothetical protein